MAQQLRRYWDYVVTDDQRVELRDHVEVSTSQRIKVERDETDLVAEVYLVPARGPDVVMASRSVSGSSHGLGGPPSEPGVNNRRRRRQQPGRP